MTASYDRLLEIFCLSDKERLQHLIELDVIHILEDADTRNLFKGFIERLDRDSNFDTNAMKAVKYFDILSAINTLDDLRAVRDEVEKFCSKLSDLTNVVDESTLNGFLHEQKKKTYRDVDDSDEYRRFKEYLRHEYQKPSRRRWRRRQTHH